MPDRLNAFSDVGLDKALLSLVIDEHHSKRVPRLEKLWTYFRNPLEPVGSVWSSRVQWRPAQYHSLPPRLIGSADQATDDRTRNNREVVIENDIGWRIETMVDFMFGKPVQIQSAADKPDTRTLIEEVLENIWENSGGIALLQDIALLGHVYGSVDLLLRIDEQALALAAPRQGRADIDRIAAAFRIEIIEPTRGIPILNPDDYRTIDAYVIHFDREINQVERESASPRRSIFGRASTWPNSKPHRDRSRRRSTVTEIFSRGVWHRYEDDELVAHTTSTLLAGITPVVHIQNVAQPFRYEGRSEVEPLIPLQDELNTRLSDRANRVTLQSFRMYLAKGMDGFDRIPVGPGQIWTTDNPDASVQSFGGDADSPSESVHIDEIREAMDKISGVPPLAGGVIRAKIGNLSSATALRVTLMGLIARTGRKRVMYGRGIEQVCSMILRALDAAQVLRTDERDRAIRLIWPNPVPADARDEAAVAKTKIELGVPAERVLGELGYAATDPGIS